MKTLKWFKTFKNSQKFRLVIDNKVRVVTSINDLMDLRIRSLIQQMDDIRSKGDPCVGLGVRLDDCDIQISLM